MNLNKQKTKVIIYYYHLLFLNILPSETSTKAFLIH